MTTVSPGSYVLNGLKVMSSQTKHLSDVSHLDQTQTFNDSEVKCQQRYSDIRSP